MRLAIALALAGCVNEPRSVPFVAIDASAMPVDRRALVVEGAYPWEVLGFTLIEPSDRHECPRWWFNPSDGTIDTECVITIRAAEQHGPGGARADYRTREIFFDPTVRTGWDLWLLAAHEIGHILLDANHLPEGERGLMDSAITSSSLTDADRAFACREIGICR